MIPTKADLARLDLDNEIELWSTGAAFTADWASGREGDVAWFASGLPVAFFNQVVATGDAADPAALVRAVRVLRGRDVPFLVRLRDGIDDAAVPAIEALGLHEDHDEAYPAMALHPIPADVGGSTVAGDLEIRRAIDAAGLEDHLAVVSAGFRMPIELARRLVPVEELGVPASPCTWAISAIARSPRRWGTRRAGRSASTTSRRWTRPVAAGTARP